MFSKSIKSYPAGTFIRTSFRTLAILQLCLSFTILSFYAGYPFMGELFEIKSEKILYETVMGKESLETKKFFLSLSPQEREGIELGYKALNDKGERPLPLKLNDSLHILLMVIPPFEKAWIFFSVVISILLLLKIEGARPAAWLLPLIVLALGIDSFNASSSNKHSFEKALFPTEDYLIRNYLRSPLSSNISSQREELLYAYRLYLIKEWAHDSAPNETSQFLKKAREGEFFFNVARLNAKRADFAQGVAKGISAPIPIPILVLYFSWNFFFAWFINRNSIGK